MNLLSKYRTELFGIAAMGTVLTHSQYFIRNLPKVFAFVFGYGGSGVYIFALLSGMGLYFSLSQGTVNNAAIWRFYKKRMVRVVVPYLLIVGVWYAVKYCFILKEPLLFLYELSTLSFWCEHKGAWYIAMLFPVYFVFPFYFQWLEMDQNKRRNKTIFALAVNSVIGIVLYSCNQEFFTHISGVWCCLYFFIYGAFIGKSMKERCFNDMPVLLFGIAIIAIKTLIPLLRNYTPLTLFAYAMAGITVAVISSRVFDALELKLVKRITGFLGEYSLEIYLSNLVWVQIFQFWKLENIFNDQGYAEYSLIIIFGILTSIIFGKVSRKLLLR